MTYKVVITKAGVVIYSHDIVLAPDAFFSDQFASVLNIFRMNNPNIALTDTDVALSLNRAV